MNATIFSLAQLPVGHQGTIIQINALKAEKERFIDLGLAPSSQVKTLFKSPSKNPTAYEVMGAVLALRKEDASKILIKET